MAALPTTCLTVHLLRLCARQLPRAQAKQVKGAVKQVVGKAVGDTKLELEGKADKIEGKVQNAIGGLKDTLKGK